MNYIKDIITDDRNETVTFFLQTGIEDNNPIWYWTVNADDITAKSCEDKGMLGFVNNEENSHLGTSVAGFDTLQEAYDDYYEGTEV